jgi:hypothetical protein
MTEIRQEVDTGNSSKNVASDARWTPEIVNLPQMSLKCSPHAGSVVI